MSGKRFGIGLGQANDASFCKRLAARLDTEGFATSIISFPELASSFQAAREGALSFDFFLDRGSFDHPTFGLLARELERAATKVINSLEAVALASSKADLVRLFEKNGIPLPRLEVLSSLLCREELYTEKDVAKLPEALGVPFTLKLTYGGYASDVVLNANTPKNVLDFLEDNPLEDVLAAEYVVPAASCGKTAWWRVLFVGDEIRPLWWDPQNHFYQEFGDSAEERAVKEAIVPIAEKIRTAVPLTMFSSEIVQSADGRLLVVDFVNHPIDVSSQQETADGLPEPVLDWLIDALVKSL